MSSYSEKSLLLKDESEELRKLKQNIFLTSESGKMCGITMPSHHDLSVAFHNLQQQHQHELNNNNLSIAFTKPPGPPSFLLPAQFYKNLFATAAIYQKSPTSDHKFNSEFGSPSPPSPVPPFPRNLLFSCVPSATASTNNDPTTTEKLNSDDENDVDEVGLIYPYFLSYLNSFWFNLNKSTAILSCINVSFSLFRFS